MNEDLKAKINDARNRLADAAPRCHIQVSYSATRYVTGGTSNEQFCVYVSHDQVQTDATILYGDDLNALVDEALADIVVRAEASEAYPCPT